MSSLNREIVQLALVGGTNLLILPQSRLLWLIRYTLKIASVFY